ncbi:hypothetical protein XELAEV_18041720mg [Xenopus laevis]|uniref:Uncharacterized protein n=1 Tax=Xenopus laevis TaxID=8355 RepID=A0A974H5D5_XENLA|nr:hypothetical protein XELAEV_18041720mg [Xenopus laevis]
MLISLYSYRCTKIAQWNIYVCVIYSLLSFQRQHFTSGNLLYCLWESIFGLLLQSFHKMAHIWSSGALCCYLDLSHGHTLDASVPKNIQLNIFPFVTLMP